MAYRSAIAARSPASGSARERLQVQGNSMLDGRMYLTQELRPHGWLTANAKRRKRTKGATPRGAQQPENATDKRRIVQC